MLLFLEKQWRKKEGRVFWTISKTYWLMATLFIHSYLYQIIYFKLFLPFHHIASYFLNKSMIEEY